MFPRCLHLLGLFTQILQLFPKYLQAVLTQMIGLILKSGFLNLPLHDLSGYLIQFSRHGIKLRLNHRTCLIDQIDCLIWQETVSDIPV